jgi:hypothetical protein
MTTGFDNECFGPDMHGNTDPDLDAIKFGKIYTFLFQCCKVGLGPGGSVIKFPAGARAIFTKYSSGSSTRSFLLYQKGCVQCHFLLTMNLKHHFGIEGGEDILLRAGGMVAGSATFYSQLT